MERREKVNACRELARRSGQNISFDPERWGENMLDSMESGLQHFLEQLPEEVRADYEDAYIEKYKQWLSAMSRCFSQAITGAGGWNSSTVRRHGKTNAAEKAARNRLDEWCEKVIKRCNRQERLTGWAEVERLQEKIDGLRQSHEIMKAANKIIRNKKLAEVEQVDELVALGFSEQSAIELIHPKYDWYGQGFSSYQLSRKLADIKDAEAKMKRHANLAQRENKEYEFAWGKIMENCQEERIQFLFDEVPDVEVRNMMKSNGFKWSPKNQAWQRQLTNNGVYAARRLRDKLNEMHGENTENGI